jgi:hypothetical protein
MVRSLTTPYAQRVIQVLISAPSRIKFPCSRNSIRFAKYTHSIHPTTEVRLYSAEHIYTQTGPGVCARLQVGQPYRSTAIHHLTKLKNAALRQSVLSARNFVQDSPTQASNGPRSQPPQSVSCDARWLLRFTGVMVCRRRLGTK